MLTMKPIPNVYDIMPNETKRDKPISSYTPNILFKSDGMKNLTGKNIKQSKLKSNVNNYTY